PTGTPTSGQPSSPTPTPIATPVVSVSNYNIKILTGTETVYGIHFTPGTAISVTFYQGSITTPVGSTTASSIGSFSVKFTVPATAVVGTAYIKTCSSPNGCHYSTVNVNLTG
ncbi:MAG TPA: hypothetical protein VET26_03430, partial [Candidatus Sulfotelmatobacter sp.]|nr:hypothetical protein [Candidatus Sulfotelmatobacter sp.]